MLALDFLRILDPLISDQNAKIHLATWNGVENPLDVFFANDFEEWQKWQSRRNFERELVISFINLPVPNKWLFAGIYNSLGSVWNEDHRQHYYTLELREQSSEMIGRLVVTFERPGRQAYLNAEKYFHKIHLAEIYAEPIRVSEFCGYRSINITKGELDLIIQNGYESWRTALSNVAGVYLITDTISGKLYVGSATGEGGIWQRWANYSLTGHGGNIEFINLIKAEGNGRTFFFRFSVLEIADIHESKESVIIRESHWKNILLTREHGLNKN